MNTILSASIIVFGLLSASSVAPLQRQAFDENCQQQVDAFLASPGWEEELLSPDLQDAGGLKQNFQRYQNILNCVNDQKVHINADIKKLAAEIQIYLVFVWRWQAPNETEGQFSLVHLKEVDNPAVEKMRAAHIPLEGEDYVLVWRYFSKNNLPPALQPYFQGEVAGITFGRHYVAYIDISPFVGQEFRKDAAQKAQATLAHELVHAYVNQSMGNESASPPLWYAEGLATYISGSSEVVLRFNRDESQIFYSFPGADYMQYSDNFVYLENLYGKEQLMRLIRQSIVDADAGLLLRKGEIPAEKDLVERANTWSRQRRMTRLALIIAGAFGLVIFGWVMVRHSPFGYLRHALGYVQDEQDVIYLEKKGRVGALIRALKVQKPENPALAVRIRRRAAQALGHFEGEPAVRALIHALHDPDAAVRDLAAQSLGKPSNTEAVEPLLQTMSVHPLNSAPEALQIIGDRRAVLPLIGLVWTESNLVNLHVAEALRTWHARDSLQRETSAALQSEEPSLRAGAAYMISYARIDALQQELFRFVRDPAEIVQAAAVRGLAHLQNAAARVELISLLRSSKAAGQEKIVQALSCEGNATAVEVLNASFSSLHSDAVKWAVIEALNKHDRGRAVSILMTLVEDGDHPALGDHAVDYLVKMGEPRAVPHLLRVLSEEGHNMLGNRLLAKVGWALGMLGDRHLVASLISCLYAPNEKQCRAAAMALLVLDTRRQFMLEDVQCLQAHMARMQALLSTSTEP